MPSHQLVSKKISSGGPVLYSLRRICGAPTGLLCGSKSRAAAGGVAVLREPAAHVQHKNIAPSSVYENRELVIPGRATATFGAEFRNLGRTEGASDASNSYAFRAQSARLRTVWDGHMVAPDGAGNAKTAKRKSLGVLTPHNLGTPRCRSATRHHSCVRGRTRRRIQITGTGAR